MVIASWVDFTFRVDFDLESSDGPSSRGLIYDLVCWTNDDWAVAPCTGWSGLAPSELPDCGLTATRSSYQASELHDFLLSDCQFVHDCPEGAFSAAWQA